MNTDAEAMPGTHDKSTSPAEKPRTRRSRPRMISRFSTSVRQSSKKTLGTVLRARRLDLQLTQRQLAAMIGVKPAHVAYLELDNRRPSLSLLSRIAQVLDLDRERLILLSHPEARSFLANRSESNTPRPRDQAWKDFKGNKSLLARHRVSKKELQVLSQVSLLGRITSARSFIFILNSIRQAVEEED